MNENSEIVDLARCLLILIWQGYDAQGHSCGRSLTCGLLEAAMMALGEPSRKAREGIEERGLELIERAREFSHLDFERADKYWMDTLHNDTSAYPDFIERLRKEIDDGFEDRFR